MLVPLVGDHLPLPLLMTVVAVPLVSHVVLPRLLQRCGRES